MVKNEICAGFFENYDEMKMRSVLSGFFFTVLFVL